MSFRFGVEHQDDAPARVANPFPSERIGIEDGFSGCGSVGALCTDMKRKCTVVHKTPQVDCLYCGASNREHPPHRKKGGASRNGRGLAWAVNANRRAGGPVGLALSPGNTTDEQELTEKLEQNEAEQEGSEGKDKGVSPLCWGAVRFWSRRRSAGFHVVTVHEHGRYSGANILSAFRCIARLNVSRSNRA